MGASPAAAGDKAKDPACARLHELEQYYKAHPKHRDKKNLATAVNNCGIAYSNKKQWNTAERYLVRALKLDPKNALFKRSLGTILASRAAEAFENNQFRKAKRDYIKALRYDPDQANYKVALSQVLYRLDSHTDKARALLKQGVEAGASGQWGNRVAQYEKEVELENRTREIRRGNWIVRMGDELGGISLDSVFSVIEAVAKSVGNDFDYRIKHRLIFVLVDQANFKQIHSGPEWAGALNDGRIKIPVTGQYREPKAFQSVLAHEYTHSVINDLAKGRKVAFWIHEGLAEYEEHKAGGKRPDFRLLKQAAKTGALIPLSFLSDSAASQKLRPGQVSLAYQQAHSFILFLIAKYRMYSVVAVIKRLGKDIPLERAVVDGIGRNLAYLETRWQEWLLQNEIF